MFCKSSDQNPHLHIPHPLQPNLDPSAQTFQRLFKFSKHINRTQNEERLQGIKQGQRIAGTVCIKAAPAESQLLKMPRVARQLLEDVFVDVHSVAGFKLFQALEQLNSGHNNFSIHLFHLERANSGTRRVDGFWHGVVSKADEAKLNLLQ